MKDQQFVESDWDYCFLLDACRYDVFSDVYDDYFDGTLEKRRSLGSSTPEWATRTLTGDLDMAYFSGNPFINSLGIPLNELKWGASCDYEWTAVDHLGEVVDVWQEGWDDSLGTVPPDSLRESFFEHRDAVARRERTVLHYMQPHAPFLERSDGRKLTMIREGIKQQGEGQDESRSVLSPIGEKVRPVVESVLEGSSLAMKAGLMLELDTRSILSNGTRETVMEHHEKNLRIALESIVEFVDELEGNIVITADHGEAFGEQGIWEHHIETHIPPLIEVPWLELGGRE
ncbi:MAG: hypothetical protein V5A55_00430 [Halovenus sp.]